jgi:hypothetical protein
MPDGLTLVLREEDRVTDLAFVNANKPTDARASPRPPDRPAPAAPGRDDAA